MCFFFIRTQITYKESLIAKLQKNLPICFNPQSSPHYNRAETILRINSSQRI